MIGRIAGPLRGWGIVQRILDLTAMVCAYKIFTQKFYNIQPCFGPSMYPTLHFNGDLLLVSKLHKHGKGVEVGDVVVFRYPFYFRSDTCKRVLGMPGDFVLRGEACAQEPLEVGEDADMTQVPEGHIWVEGDNVPWSRDSREYGPIALGLVTGKVIARIWPLSRFQLVRNSLEPAKFSDD